MRGWLWFCFLLVALVPCGGAFAADSLDVCHARSDYDLTLRDDGLLFQRAGAAPREVRMYDGGLVVDGRALALGPADQGRVRAIERGVRALLPRVRSVASRGVELAADAVREQARVSAPALEGPALDGPLDTAVADLKQRIATSHSTRDWHGPAFQQYLAQRMAGIVPLLAGPLLQRSLAAAVSGDMDSVQQLRDQAAGMRATLEARMRRKLDTLRPRIQALCPDVRELDRLENGLDARLADGSRLDLIDIGR